MAHHSHRATLKILFILGAVMVALSANAALLDCTRAQVVFTNEDCLAAGNLSRANNAYGVAAVPVGTPVVVAKPTDFQVNRNADSNLPGSVPLIVLTSALLIISLVKARAFNTK